MLYHKTDILRYLKKHFKSLAIRAAVRPLTGRVRKIEKSGGPQKKSSLLKTLVYVPQITRL